MIVTAQDTLRRALNFVGGDVTSSSPNDSTVHDCKRAITDALHDVSAAFQWSYLIKELMLTTAEPYDTGTIAYTAATRTLTLTGGTWPTWAAQGRLKLINMNCKVEQRVSGTVLILDTLTAPQDDIAALTSYILYRDQYQLPDDTQEVSRVYIDDNQRVLQFVEMSKWYRVAATFTRPGTGIMQYYTVTGDPNNYGRINLMVAPYPSQALTLRLLIKKIARDVRFWEEKAGTVSVTSSGSTVTGVGTAFNVNMVGSVIRISPDAVNYPDPLETYPAEEAKILSYTSPTSITIDGTFSQSLSGVKYVISDPIDIDMVSMWDAFMAGVRKNIGDTRSYKGENQGILSKDWDASLKEAKGRDNRNMQDMVVGEGTPDYIFRRRL